MIILNVVSTIVALVGGFLGIVSWISGRKKEKEIHQEQEDMWKLYIYIHNAFNKGNGNVWTPDTGSADHKFAEKMIEKGWLERAPMGGYCLPGTFLSS